MDRPDHTAPPDAGLCWYVAYGSNLCRDRFRCYLEGGRPAGARRDYAGARDPMPPRAEQAWTLTGQAYFALESRTWGGGMAFLDPVVAAGAAPATTPARAYLLTREQLGDVVAQEMRREPGAPLPLDGLAAGETRAVGPGHYETLVGCGPVDGVAAYTFTAPVGFSQAALAAPSAAYLRVLARGLTQTHGWSQTEALAHLVDRPGARGVWDLAGALRAVRALPRTRQG